VAKKPTPAGQEVIDLFDRIKKTHHEKRLGEAQIAVLFKEDKVFKKGRFNFGKVKKVSPETQVLLDEKNKGHYDFVVTIPDESWSFMSDRRQREGLVDLYLTMCSVEFEPVMASDPKKGGKEKPKKDNWGRIEYTDTPKYDEDGNPKWVVLPLDVETLTDNVGRCGTWCDVFRDFESAVADAQNKPQPEQPKADSANGEQQF
jgi:hypothetical protein